VQCTPESVWYVNALPAARGMLRSRA